MTFRNFVGRSVSEVFAAMSCLREPSDGLRVLMYHAVGSHAIGDKLGIYSVDPKRFHSHMRFLKNCTQYQVVNFSEAALDGSGNKIAITFDDGYRDNLTVAAPILIELGFPFTVFVTSEFISSNKPGFLSVADLRELAALPGVRIGAHGATHVPLTSCNEEELLNELVSSKKWLEDMLGYPVTKLAYPYGAVNRRVAEAASCVGYDMGACSYPGTNTTRRNRMLLARTDVLAFDNDRVFAQKLHGDWDWFRWRFKDPACA